MRYSSNLSTFTKNVLLTFQMDQNGTFLENSKYDHCILHKKLDRTFTIIHICTHISLNIVPRILNPNSPEYPFPWLVTFFINMK